MNAIPASVAACLICAQANAQTLADQARDAAIADAASTFVGLSLGAAEANPLGLIALAVKAPILEHIETLPDDEQPEAHAVVGAVWGGAVANNLCVVFALLAGGAIAPLCPMLGIGVGMHLWDKSQDEREFWRLCRYARMHWKRPDMPCIYTKVTT